jgi:hypothetical protein
MGYQTYGRVPEEIFFQLLHVSRKVMYIKRKRRGESAPTLYYTVGSDCKDGLRILVRPVGTAEAPHPGAEVMEVNFNFLSQPPRVIYEG